MSNSVSTMIVADVGNSRIKLGRFDRASVNATKPSPAQEFRRRQGIEQGATPVLPEPDATLELPLTDRSGQFDADRLAVWCDENVSDVADWILCRVHREAGQRLMLAITGLVRPEGPVPSKHRTWSIWLLTHNEVTMPKKIDAHDKVGVDRLCAAWAADRLRRHDHAAIVVDLGTAITVDLVTTHGEFAGGAILPGLAVSARALEEHTDALPRVAVDGWRIPPKPLGKSTVPAIESGLFWGAVGAVRELIEKLSVGLAAPPDVFVTGGHASLVTDELAEPDPWPLRWTVRHVPHLVLAGIAIGGAQATENASRRRSRIGRRDSQTNK